MEKPQSPLYHDLAKRLETLGIPAPALNWVMRASHPAGDTHSSGIPDESYVNCVRPLYKSQRVITKPASNANTTIPAGTWDLCIIKPPGDVTACIWATGPPGTNFASSSGQLSVFGGFAYMQAIDYSDQIVTNAITAGPMVEMASPRGVACASAFRKQYSSITAYMTSSTLNDGGTLTAGQFPCVGVNDGLQIGNVSIESPDKKTLSQRVLCTIPLTEEDMVATDPKVYTTPAKTGVYMPLRLNGPSQPFVKQATVGGGVFYGVADLVDVARFRATRSVGERVPCAFYPLSDKLNGNYVATAQLPIGSMLPPFAAGALGDLQYQAADTGYDNVSVGVIIFRGLAPDASITLKFYDGLELVSAFDGPSRQFIEPPTKYSPAAMAAYYALAQEMPTCYPSSFNSFGTILASLGAVAKKLWPVVLRTVPLVIDALQAQPQRAAIAAPAVAVRAPQVQKKKGKKKT